MESQPELFDVLSSWLGQEVLVFPPGTTKWPILVGRLRHDGGWCVEVAGRLEKIEVPATELHDTAPMYISSANRGEVRGGKYGVKNQIFTSHFKRSAFEA